MAPSRGALFSALLGACAGPHLAGAVATYPSEFRFSWCVGDSCHDHSFSSAHFQLKIHHYYSRGSRPPIREAFFVATLPVQYLRELLFACPGAVVLAHLLLAEMRVHTHPPEEGAELMARVNDMMAMPEITGPHLHSIHGSWPYAAALARYAEAVERVTAAGPASVDLVLSRCREDLGWLGDRSKIEVLPPRTRIFVYEKCGGQSALNLSNILETGVAIINIALEDAADPRTGLAARRDECTAYLAHVVRQYEGNYAQNTGDGLADVTLFLHGNPGDHTPFGLLNLVLRGLAQGGLDGLEFLHLGSPRMVHVSNPCQESIFEAAMMRPQRGPLSTYCCSQFAVGRDRILARPHAAYIRMLGLVDGTAPDNCERTGPAYEKYAGARLSHCFFFEFMWHVVFGEDEELVLRADDRRLPLSLRLRDSEGTLPSVWHGYLGAHVGGQATFSRPGHHELWLAQMLTPTDLGRATQLNYGDLVPDGR